MQLSFWVLSSIIGLISIIILILYAQLQVNKQLKCLRRIRNYISIPQAKILGNSYIYLTFNYWSLILVICSKITNNKINEILSYPENILFK